MKYFTAQYRGRSNSRVSLAVQHYAYGKKEICFACIAEESECAEGLYHWFRGQILGKYKNGYGMKLKRIEKSLRKEILRMEITDVVGNQVERGAMAGVLCIGDFFVGFEQGHMGIFCLNTAFGRAHMEPLREREYGERAVEREIFVGSLEPGVALLLVTEKMLQAAGEKILAESLFVGDMNREGQMYRHLRELVEEVSRNGVEDVAAILLHGCREEDNIENSAIGFQGEWMEERDVENGENTGKVQKGVHVREFFAENFVSHKHFVWGQLVGKGAFSQVYKVRNRQTGELYACKQSEVVSMLWREYRLGRELEHPLFPKVYDFWQEKGKGFLLMEYVPGNTLKHLLEHRGHFSAKQTIQVGMELAEGLLYLHEWKYPSLFRDVKPENILIRQDGRVKLLDLGCVCGKEEQWESRAGSPGYAAPEQLESGRKLDVTCDVYGLAKTMERMLGCRKKCLQKQGKKFVFQWQEWRLERQLRQILRHCTRIEAECRIPDMRWLLLALAQLQGKRRRRCAGSGKRSRIPCYGKKLRCLKNVWERGAENP